MISRSFASVSATFALAAGFVSCAWTGPVAADEGKKSEPPQPRSYETGPLTVDDFAGQPDPERQKMGISAFTTCELRWNFRFEFNPKGDGFVSRVTRIEVAMSVVPAKSWNVVPDNAALLDHEQGHFDVWRIHELRALAAAKKREGYADLTVTSSTVEEAKTKLDAAVATWTKRFIDAAREENIEYDRVTRHGVDAMRQAECRRVQQETLKALTAKAPKP